MAEKPAGGGSVRPATVVATLQASTAAAPSTTAMSTTVAMLCVRACGFGFSKMNLHTTRKVENGNETIGCNAAGAIAAL